MMTWNTRTNCVRRLLELLVLNMVVYIKYNKRYALKGYNTAAVTVINKIIVCNKSFAERDVTTPAS